MLIPKLLWPLQIYEVGLACVEAIEKKISCYTRKWLGLPPGLTSVVLHSKTAKLRLPLKAVTEEYKVGKARLQMMFSYSKDASVSITETKLKSGRKWKVQRLYGDIGKIISFLTDFKAAAIYALHKVFPEVKVRGCSFHFRQAIVHRVA